MIHTTEQHDAIRTGVTVSNLKQAFLDNLYFIQARFPAVATRNDHYMALAYTIRDRLLRKCVESNRVYYERAARTVCYLSAEYLLGPHLGNNLVNLGLMDRTRQAMAELGINLDDLLDQEEEPGLGNGGLGRLAACFLDSLATLQIPTIGYGIRYEFGIFDQAIRDGWQVEVTDKWLRFGNPWEIARPEITFPVGYGGHTRTVTDANGNYHVEWIPDQLVMGMAFDTPILGFRVNNANLLRLWHAQACESFDFQAFNAGDYFGAVNAKIVSENISKILYPNDTSFQGKALRLQQQYFFASCSLQDMVRLYHQRAGDLTKFHEKYAVQLNDTHPSVAVAELMRILVDQKHMDWDAAWEVTRKTFAYTNHTLMPEALEVWSIELFGRLLPRHLEIIYEINRRFLDTIRIRYPGDEARLRRMSLIDESGNKSVRMANLACVGTHTVNGVAELHSRLLRENLLKDFAELEPEKYTNVTNGVTPRRFMMLSNPLLSDLITTAIGDSWPAELKDLAKLTTHAEDASFRSKWRAVKRAAKVNLATMVRARTGLEIDPDSLFDVQAKRFHEYKRQHLNVLHIITRYLRLKDSVSAKTVPRTVLFAGKAAPGYFLAKLIIKLINSVAHVVNTDPSIQGKLRVAFIPDFNVQTGQRVYPAADLSEQISTAGTEASGTGNMKFAMNGALTIGTLDGANIEIRNEVGAEHFFTFGLTTEQVHAKKSSGYEPAAEIRRNPELQRVFDRIADGTFSSGDRELFRPILDNLMHHDPYLVLADYASYIAAQDAVDQVYANPEQWSRSSILNVAHTGYFSSDRSIQDYCTKVWHVSPVPVTID